MDAADAIIEAIQNGDLEEIQTLIQKHPKLIDYVTPSGVLISLYAAYHQKKEIWDWIMSRRIAPNIFEAAAFGMKDRIITLLSEKPNLINAFAPDGFTPLGLACYFNRYEAVKILLFYGADVNLPAKNGANVAPIHSAVAANNLDITLYLLENKAEVNALQNGGIAALHAAAHRGNAKMVRLLLEHGANPDLKTDKGLTALDFAQADGHEEVIKLLE